MKASEVKRPSKTMKFKLPWLVMAEIMLQLNRFPVAVTTRVWPFTPQVRPTAWSLRRPISSPQKIRAPNSGLLSDRGLFCPRPVTDLSRVLLIGLPYRLLRGETPPPQVAPNSREGEANAELTFDEGADGLKGPEHKGASELVRILATNLSDYPRGLMLFELTATFRTPLRLGLEGLDPSGVISLEPLPDGNAGNAEEGGHFASGLAVKNRLHSSRVVAFLGLGRKCSGIGNVHARKIHQDLTNVDYLLSCVIT